MARKKRERRKVSAKRWRQEQRGGSIYLKLPEGMGTFQAKADRYQLDFMSFVAGEGNPRAEKGEEYYERTFFVHRDVGPNKEWHLCLAKTLREPCPICEYRSTSMADPDADEKEIKDLAPKERQLWLVRNLREDSKETLLWEFSYHLFGKALRDKLNNADEEDGYDYFADPEEGYSLRIAFQQSDRGKWVEAVDIEFKSRKVQYDADVVEGMPCLDDILVSTPYDKLKKLFLQAEEPEDGDDEPEVRKPARGKKERKKDEDVVEVEVGGTVFYKGGPCEVLKIGGDDGEKLMLEMMDGDVVKAVVDDLDVGPSEKKKEEKSAEDEDDWSDEPDEKESKSKPKPKSKKKEEADDDDWFDEPEEKEEKPKSKPKPKSKKKEEADDDDWFDD